MLPLGVEVEDNACDFDLVPRLEAGLQQRVDHADSAKPPLEMRERLVVVEVVAREKTIDSPTCDRVPALCHLADLERAIGGGAEHAVLGELAVGRRRRWLVLGLGQSRHLPRELGRELSQPQTAHRGGDDHRRFGPEARLPVGALLLPGRFVDEVGFGQRQHARQPRQCRLVECELSLDDLVVSVRIGSVERGQVEDVDEEPRALDVSQELVPETGSARSALDQTRDVRDHELAFLALERPKDRLERRERIIGDFGVRPREAGEQRRFPRVGQPDQPDIGDQLQLQRDPCLIARQTALGEAGRLVGRAREALVAAAARTATGDRHPLSGPHEVNSGAVVLDERLGSRRHRKLERLAIAAVPQSALTVAARARLELAAAAVALEVAHRVIADEHHVAAAPAIPAVGTPSGHVSFPAEAEAAVAAGAGSDFNAGSILHLLRCCQLDDSRGLHNASPDGERRPSVSDRVLLITGASSGIGAATARHAAAAGYRVALGARSLDRLAALADELGGPERALAVGCDVTDWEAQRSLVAACLDTFGRLDAAFANAGFGAPRGFLESDPDHWRSMVLTNVYGAALTIRATLPALKESRGHLLLTGSVAGRRALPGSLYSATKWAVTAMGEAARQELNGTGVRVTLIEPGMVDTPFFESRPSQALEPDDIARAVMFALEQPSHVDVNEILVRPTAQDG